MTENRNPRPSAIRAAQALHAVRVAQAREAAAAAVVDGLFADGLELDPEVREQLERSAEFVAGSAELMEITAQAAMNAREALRDARSAVELADDAHQRSLRAVDLANAEMRKLLRANNLIRTASGLVERPGPAPASWPGPAMVDTIARAAYAEQDAARPGLYEDCPDRDSYAGPKAAERQTDHPTVCANCGRGVFWLATTKTLVHTGTHNAECAR